MHCNAGGELLFADTAQQAKATRDPVAPAQRSPTALAKVAAHTLDDGTPVHSFANLMTCLDDRTIHPRAQHLPYTSRR